MGVVVLGPSFIYGVPETIPVIPGFEVKSHPKDWMLAKGKGKEWFIKDGGTHWILNQCIRERRVSRKHRNSKYVDTRVAIAVPKE
jgi:hypothetical protein